MFQVLQRFELVNYGCFGSFVDKIWYGMEKSKPEHPATAVPSKLKSTVNEIIEKRRQEIMKQILENKDSNSNTPPLVSIIY